MIFKNLLYIYNNLLITYMSKLKVVRNIKGIKQSELNVAKENGWNGRLNMEKSPVSHTPFNMQMEYPKKEMQIKNLSVNKLKRMPDMSIKPKGNIKIRPESKIYLKI
jgi:hypothetical protein